MQFKLAITISLAAILFTATSWGCSCGRPFVAERIASTVHENAERFGLHGPQERQLP